MLTLYYVKRADYKTVYLIQSQQPNKSNSI